MDFSGNKFKESALFGDALNPGGSKSNIFLWSDEAMTLIL